MKGSWRSLTWESTPRVAIGLVTLSGVVLCWRLGWLQALDLALYDWFLRNRPTSSAALSPVTLVTINDEDMHQLDYPLRDNRLAELLDILAAAQPRVIGLDLYRDLPEPRSGTEAPRLTDALCRLTNVVAIYRLPDSERPGIAPPPALAAEHERVGFNNFPVDALDERIRRGLLYAGFADGTNWTTVASFALQVAKGYLEYEGCWPEPGRTKAEHLQLGRQEYVPLKEHDGAYVGADTDGYQCLLDFEGPDSFVSFTAVEALAGRIPLEAIRDRAVLIGVMSESVRDEQPSPVRARVRGVEWQGQFVDQIVRRSRTSVPPMRFVSEVWEGLLAVLCALGAAAVAGRGRSAWTWLLWGPGGLALLIALNQAGLRGNWWVPVAPAGLAWIGTATLGAVWNWQREWRQREVLMGLFSKHVSPEIAQLLWRQRHAFMEGRRPRAQALTATVLFTDLGEFARRAEQTQPGALLDWLNEYIEAMTARILAHDGVILEYVGDAILSTFGIPIPRATEAEIDRDARRAVTAALAMAAALEELNGRWALRGLAPADMRVGIATGSVVAGSLGSQDRLKYAVVGNTVVTASRLESLDKSVAAPDSPLPHCRILVSESTWERVRTDFEGRCLGSFVLKGRHGPTTIHHVLTRVNTMETT